jgi:hypothetical protein
MSGIGVVTRMLAAPAMVFSIMSAPLADAASINWGGGSSTVVPAAAASAGYRMETFVTNSNFTRNTVDMGLTKASGFQWYFFNFFYLTPSSSLAQLNTNGSITIHALPNNYGNYIASATQIPTAPYFRGTAFGGGGYFEATLSYNQSQVNMANGWPAWWTMAIEHLAGLSSAQWPGQATGYDHFIEPDIFEADTGSAASYGGAIHDWWGAWGVQPCPQYCNIFPAWSTVQRITPTGTNPMQMHRYGLLWVPATATTPGSYTYYFDGVQIGKKVTFTKYTNQPPVPTATTPWTYGIVDKQHLVLILSVGSTSPMTVQNVQVWQASTANNLKY